MWEPSETSFAEQEDGMAEIRGEGIISETIGRGERIINTLFTGEDDFFFFNALNNMVNVARVDF